MASVPWDEEQFEGMTEDEMDAEFFRWYDEEDFQEQLHELSEASTDDILAESIDDLDQMSVVCQVKAVLDAKRSKLTSQKKWLILVAKIRMAISTTYQFSSYLLV